MSWAADAYLLKSTDLTELKEKIKELLEQRRLGSKISQTEVEVGRTNIERKTWGKK